MRRLMPGVVAFVALVSAASAQAPPRDGDFFSIAGYVVDTDGHLVASAEVRASPVDRGGFVPMSHTQAGRFTLRLDGPGRYRVYCFKGTKGYRDMTEELFSLDPEGIPEVTVTDRSPNPLTVVRLGPSGAHLTVRLIDSVTGQPLEQAQLLLQREDNPNYRYIRPLVSFDKEGKIKLVLPSRPLKLAASSPGYENWSFGESGGKEHAALLLAPDETREITVALRPLKKNQ
jgi:hypothetical protein